MSRPIHNDTETNKCQQQPQQSNIRLNRNTLNKTKLYWAKARGQVDNRGEYRGGENPQNTAFTLNQHSSKHTIK